MLYRLHNTPWADLFAFHYTLDRPFVRARYTASIVGAFAGVLVAVSVFTVAAQLRARTAVAETRAPQLVALLVASLPGLLLVAATSGGLPAVVG